MYTIDLCVMCNHATNWSNTSAEDRNDDPAPGIVFNTASQENDRKTGDKDQRKSLNAKNGT